MTLHVPRLPFSLDPLIGEAKRRARQRRLLVVLLAGAVVAAAVGLAVELRGLGSAPSQLPARLTVLAVNPYKGRALFHLTCAPPGGNVSQPAEACAAIAAQPSLITAPKPFICNFGEDFWDITISGRLNGKPVNTKTGTCWTTQMALIDKLGLASRGMPLRLERRRSVSIKLGQTRRFSPGSLRPGDLVTCNVSGRHLAWGVPDQTGGPGYIGTDHATLSTGLHPDGSVIASCLQWPGNHVGKLPY